MLIKEALIRTTLVLASSVLLAFFETAEAANTKYVDVVVGITGDNSLSGLDDPVTVLKTEEVSRLMQDLADRPRDKRFVANALKGSPIDLQRLLTLGLIRETDRNYVINFPYITVEDTTLLRKELDPFAEALADEYIARREAFDKIFDKYDQPQVTAQRVAYAVIGAMSLDWDGLTITDRLQLRTTAENMPQGQSFIPWAKETASPETLKGLYWGSHNDEYGDVHFTTFGDHASPKRRGLPDYLWNIYRPIASMDGDVTPLSIAAYQALEPYYLADASRDIGAALLAMRAGAATSTDIAEASGVDKARIEGHLKLLAELDYVAAANDGYALRSPVFDERDREMIENARALSSAIILAHLKMHYNATKSALTELTALKYGVPYENLYTEIWHYLFGLTNLKLAERRYFFDPYGSDAKYEGFAPFAYKRGVYEEDQIGIALP